MTTDYEIVVMDGANLIHDDTGIEKYDDVEGSRIIQILPDRLEAAINHCENLGWPTVACLKRGTYKWAANNPESKYVGDISIIDRLISEGKVILLSAKKEDIYWIDYALKENAWIVTHDRFNDKKGTQGERSLYPDRDWKEIDSRTLRGHEFVNNKFILPGLPKKEILEQKPNECVTLVQFNKLEEKVRDLEAMIRKMNHSEIMRETSNPTEEENWLIITSSFHMKRALNIAEKLNWNFIPYPVDFRTSNTFNERPSINFLRNINAFDIAMHEIVGIFAYYILGRSNKIF